MIAALALAASMLNVDVRQSNLRTTVCRPGYAASIRPPSAFTSRIKRKLIPPGHKSSEYVLDHIVSLEIGGAPRALANLQLQTVADGKLKDRRERALHKSVCAGTVTLHDAQLRISAWKP